MTSETKNSGKKTSENHKQNNTKKINTKHSFVKEKQKQKLASEKRFIANLLENCKSFISVKKKPTM